MTDQELVELFWQRREEALTGLQDKYGGWCRSIAGRIHGTIDNCVSYATVYGTNYVGGILGTRDNAMGGCAVTNCTFGGTVEASGEQAGGIVGGGYSNSTAPNGAKVNVENCSSASGGDGRGTRSLWPLWSWLSASPAGRGPRNRPRRRSWGGPSPPS